MRSALHPPTREIFNADPCVGISWQVFYIFIVKYALSLSLSLSSLSLHLLHQNSPQKDSIRSRQSHIQFSLGKTLRAAVPSPLPSFLPFPPLGRPLLQHSLCTEGKGYEEDGVICMCRTCPKCQRNKHPSRPFRIIFLQGRGGASWGKGHLHAIALVALGLGQQQQHLHLSPPALPMSQPR